jgi:hypothetical protein
VAGRMWAQALPASSRSSPRPQSMPRRYKKADSLMILQHFSQRQGGTHQAELPQVRGHVVEELDEQKDAADDPAAPGTGSPIEWGWG